MTELSPIFGLTIPEADGSDDADLATLLRSLGLDVENKAGGITAMTSVQRTALTGTGKYAGRTVYQTDDGTLWRSNGTDWRQVVLLDASGHLPMGGQKITGLAAGTANGDAVRYEQVAASYAIGVRTTGSQALSGPTLVSYSSETDPSAMLSSGTFTLPSAGLWLVTGTVFGDTQQTGLGAQLYIEHASNGVAWQAWKDYAASVSVVVVASASDTVRLYANGSGNITNARATVAKIGA